MRRVLVIQPAPCGNYEKEMDDEEFYALKRQAMDNIVKTMHWKDLPKWCKHIVAYVKYGGNRATVYLEPFQSDEWAWKEYFTNPARDIEYVMAYHKGTAKL